MRIENRIHIEAPAAAVWAATENVSAWPEWTPTVTAAQPLTDGPLRIGSRYLLKQPMQAKAAWEVTACTTGRSFTWERRGAFVRYRATHQLEPSGTGTSNLLILEIGGPATILLGPVLRRAATAALAQENAGLKAFCEKRNT